MDGFIALHTLRCIGAAGEERVAMAAGSSVPAVLDQLRMLADQGAVVFHEGPFSAWMLTDEGRALDRSLVSAELSASGRADLVREGYGAFLELNPVLLQVCHDWQMSEVGGRPILNDHSDEGYDAQVLSRLWDVDDEVQTVCAGLSAALPRFSAYGPRLTRARERALAGDHASVTEGFDSYHAVWFQLHEDLLTTLDVSREDEGSR